MASSMPKIEYTEGRVNLSPPLPRDRVKKKRQNDDFILLNFEQNDVKMTLK